MFGNFIIFASGCFAKSPNTTRASSTFWSSFKNSEKLAKILAAKEMSFTSISILDVFVKAFTIGKKERVANPGASSVFVYIILAFVLMLIVF